MYFIWLSTKGGCLGSKPVFSKTSRSYTVFSARSTKPKEPFNYSGSWEQIPFPRHGRRLLLESGLPPGKHKKNREPKSKTSPERDGFSPELEAGENVNSELGITTVNSHACEVPVLKQACGDPPT